MKTLALLGLIAPGAAGWVVAGDSPMAGPGNLAEYGVLGIFASGSIFALVFFVKAMRSEHQEALRRERENVDRLQKRLDDTRTELKATHDAWAAEVRDMHTRMQEKVIPALVAATDMTKEAMQLIRDANRRGPR